MGHIREKLAFRMVKEVLEYDDSEDELRINRKTFCLLGIEGAIHS